MRLEDLKWTKGVPVVSEPTLFAHRNGGSSVWLVTVSPSGRATHQDGRSVSTPNGEYAPIPTTSTYLPRVEQPEEGRRYECIYRDGQWSTVRVLRFDGGAWRYESGSAATIHEREIIYGPLPDREPDPEPLERRMARLCDSPLLNEVWVRNGKVVEFVNCEGRRVTADEPSNWQIAHEWQFKPTNAT